MKLVTLYNLVMESGRKNNIDPNLASKLKDAGWLITTWWASAGRGFWDTATPENADQVVVTNNDFQSVTIKLPGSKLVDADYILNAIAKKQKVESVFINLSAYMDKMLKPLGIGAYPASYGVGVVAIYNKLSGKERDEVTKILDNLGLEYTNEHSDAGWVYRYKVSRNKHNIDILSRL